MLVDVSALRHPGPYSVNAEKLPHQSVAIDPAPQTGGLKLFWGEGGASILGAGQVQGTGEVIIFH